MILSDPLRVGPVTVRGGESSALLASGSATAELSVDVLDTNLVRVRLLAQATEDSGLLGFSLLSGARPDGLSTPAVILSHPNLDQESRGLPSHRLRRGQSIERGFDQAIHTREGTLVISCERPDRWVTVVSVVHDRRGLGFGVKQCETPLRDGAIPVHVAAGAHVESDAILIGYWDDPLEGLERHAELMGRACAALPSPEVPAPRGWNSWDHYGWMINERIVLAEADALPVDAGYRFMGVSGPWFTNFGDWQPHMGRFPRGIGALSDDLRERGLKTNLWLAPFLVEDDSDVFRQHPDWLILDQSGQPVLASMAPSGAGVVQYSERRCAILDATHPEVGEHLTSLAQRLTHDEGADYLFVDFLRAAELPGLRSDRSATGVQALRRGMEALRRGMREGTMLMGGSGTVGLYPGLVHAGRIGPDITLPPIGHPVFVRWTQAGVDPEQGFVAAGFPPAAGRAVPSWRGVGGVHNEVCALAARWYLHGRALQANPDAILLSLPLAEARTVAALWALTGGILLAGDSLASLPEDRRALLTHEWLLRIHGEHRSARPLDLFTRPGALPSVWSLAETRYGDFVAVVCWDDYSMRRVVTTSRRNAEDAWTGRALPLRNGKTTLVVEPHDTALVRFFD